MTPLENLIKRMGSNAHGWVALSGEECKAVHSQIDSMIDTLDAVSLILHKLGVYLPEGTYPETLVREALSHIHKHWEIFLTEFPY